MPSSAGQAMSATGCERLDGECAPSLGLTRVVSRHVLRELKQIEGFAPQWRSK